MLLAVDVRGVAETAVNGKLNELTIAEITIVAEESL